MGTSIRPEISDNNTWWISRHRYYELKHFCLQYLEWKKEHAALGYQGRGSVLWEIMAKQSGASDPVGNCVEARAFYFERMRLIEQTAVEAAQDLSSYILKAVTEGISYDHLKARLEIPCSRDVYYDRYRRFFWLLSRARQ